MAGLVQHQPRGGHVVVLGMMASGKTSVGQELARRTGRRLLDSDQQILETHGQEVRAIAEAQGIDEVHRLEKEAFHAAMQAPRPSVLAVAASVIEDDAAREILADGPFVIWLRIRSDTMLKRMGADPGNHHRPELAAQDAKDQVGAIEALIARRSAAYEEVADLVLDVDELDIDVAVSRVLMANPLPELVIDQHQSLAEGPVWDPAEGVLWWIDILERQIHRFDPSTRHDEEWEIAGTPGAIALRRGGGLVVCTEEGLAAFHPERPLANRLEPLHPLERDITANRANDAKCDRRGRFWIGTMAVDFTPEAGALYRMDPDGRTQPMIPRATIPNGMAWSSDDSTFYYADSMAFDVKAFDFDAPSGDLRNARVHVRFQGQEGGPDGLTIDREDCLWVTHFASGPGSRSAVPGGVFRFDRTGRKRLSLELPVTYVTSVCFGGEDLSELYITTGRNDVPEADLVHEPHAGGVFRWKAEVAGDPLFTFAG